MDLRFAKFSGTGNDFILVDNRQGQVADADMARLARLCCRRGRGVGADGMIFIQEHPEADFQWHFFNADGSEAEMCGNGARCAARFAHQEGIAGKRMRFLTLAGIIQARVDGEMVDVRLTPPAEVVTSRGIQVRGQDLEVPSMNTGVPHALVFVEDIGQAPVRELGAAIRHHQAFMPAGTNVNFVQVTGPGSLAVRTYERGVEDETLACGTGAVASAMMAALRGQVRPPVTVTTSGGERLEVLFQLLDSGGIDPDQVFLRGPALRIYDARLRDGALVEG